MSQESILVDWREFATSKRWVSQLQKKSDDKTVPQKTLEAMNMWMPQFLRFHQKTPDELIEESISDSEMAGDRLDDFYRFKKETIDRNSCITGIYGTLRGFYRHNKVNVQDIIAPKFSPREIKKTDANYPLFEQKEYEDVGGHKIKKLILNRPLLREFSSHLNYRDQCILLCILSSGLDSNDILKLTVGDIRQQENHSRIYLNDARNKTFREYKDFFSIEATKRLRSYIAKDRMNASDDEPLFVTTIKGRKTEFKKKTGRQSTLNDELPKGHKLKSGELSEAFRRAAKAMGVNLTKAKQSPLRPKRFRKIFKTACSNSQLDRDIIKIFLGQAGDASQSYEEDDRNTMEFHYELVEPKITLFQDEDLENDEMMKLRKQIHESDEQKTKDAEIQKDEIARLTQSVNMLLRERKINDNPTKKE